MKWVLFRCCWFYYWYSATVGLWVWAVVCWISQGRGRMCLGMGKRSWKRREACHRELILCIIGREKMVESGATRRKWWWKGIGFRRRRTERAKGICYSLCSCLDVFVSETWKKYPAYKNCLKYSFFFLFSSDMFIHELSLRLVTPNGSLPCFACLCHN